MPDYEPPLAEIRFVLEHVCHNPEPSLDSTLAVIADFGRFVTDEVAHLNRVGDIAGSHWGGASKNPTVTTLPGFRTAYARYVEAGWPRVTADRRIGGDGFPFAVGVALREILNSGNMAFALAPHLTQSAVGLLAAHGTEHQKQRYLPKMVSGVWAATMELTEPDAGSDLAAIRTRAVPTDDGTFRITGTKTLITYGDHDLAENIIHFVLARISGAPEGVKGISCFLVPKVLVDDDDENLAKLNGIRVTALANKLGIRAAPACDLEYNDAVGFLIGPENRGLPVMFTMMNTARIGVAAAGLGLCEAAWQRARHHTRNRRQGRASGTVAASPIVDHPDVRRMLMTMKASTEALRAVVYFTAAQVDLGRDDAAAAALAGLLTPVAKAWGSDLANEVTSLAVQVFGGLGYLEDTGVAQLFRDARVTSIYEGTNGMQAIDLVTRKLPLDASASMTDLMVRMQGTASELQDDGLWPRGGVADSCSGVGCMRGETALSSIGEYLDDALGVLRQANQWILRNGADDPGQALAAATPYLRLVSVVLGGWLLAVEAQAATQADPSTLPGGFVEAKVATANFFAHHLLTTVHGLLPDIVAGKADLFALTADQL